MCAAAQLVAEADDCAAAGQWKTLESRGYTAPLVLAADPNDADLLWIGCRYGKFYLGGRKQATCLSLPLLHIMIHQPM